MGSPAIFKGSKVKLLKDEIEFFNDVRSITNSTVDPSSTATDGEPGSILRDQDGRQWIKQDSGSTTNWSEVGVKDPIIFFDDGRYAVTGNYTHGNNSDFDGGVGTPGGTYTVSTTAADLIRGPRVYKLVGSATAANNDDDYLASNPIDIPLGYRGRQLGISVQYKSELTSDYAKWCVKDTDNGDILTTGSEFIKQHDTTDNTAATFTLSFFCPPDCTQVEIGPQIITGEVSKTLIWSDVLITADPYVTASIANVTGWESYTPALVGLGTPTNVDFIWRRVGDSVEIQGRFTSGTSTATEVQVPLPDGHIIENLSATVQVVGSAGISANASAYTMLATNADTFLNIAVCSSGSFSPVNGNTFISSGQHFSLFARVPVVGWAAESEHVVAYNERSQNSTVRVQGPNGHGTSSTKIPRFSNIIENTGNAITYADSATLGATFAINETGIYHVSLTASNSASFQAWGISKNSTQLTTSILSITAADRLASEQSDTNTSLTGTCSGAWLFNKGDIIRPHDDGSAYAVTQATMTVTKIGASQLLGVPLPLTAYLKDLKASGTAGGATSTNTVHTRTLNDLSGDTSFISLDTGTDRFTLGPGTYNIIVESPTYKALDTQLFLYNVTDSAYTIDGMSGGGTITDHRLSTLRGRFTITATKVFAIRHWIAQGDGNGFGFAANGTNNPQSNEVYTTVEVTKVN